MDWFVYTIYNKKSDKIYIGQTNNLNRRLVEHNKKLGKHYTAGIDGEWELIYKEKQDSRKDAIIREKQLKSYQGRQFIKNLIFNIPL